MTSQNGHPAKPDLIAEPSDQLVELMTRYHEALNVGAAPASAVLPGDNYAPSFGAPPLKSDLLETAAHEADSLDADSRAQFQLAKSVLERLARVGGELAAADDPRDLDFFTALASFAPLLGTEMSGAAQVSGNSTEAASADPLRVAAVRKFGRFEIVRELGRGGLGVVFLAHDPVLNRQVAIKIPRPEALMIPDLRLRFSREAQAAARLTHPHLVSVYEVGEVGPICYIASAFVEGPNLATWLRGRRPPPTTRQAASIVAVLADAMQYAHRHGVLHRDLKPSNVLLEPGCQSGDGDSTFSGIEFTPKITDFGLAKLEDLAGDFTRTGLVLGTPAYMAPEQAHGKLDEIDARTDVYGLGAILFELLTGHPPCAGTSEADTLRRVVTDEPVFRGDSLRALPADLRAIALKCLEKVPRRRYQTAGELAADLRRFLAGQPTKARPLGLFGRAMKWSRRRPTAAALAIVSCAAAVSLLAGSLYYSVHTTQLLRIADALRRQAEEKEKKLRGLLYAADMPLAYKAYQRNNIEQMHELLERHVPRNDQADVRSFAWCLLDRLGHAERHTLKGHGGEVFTLQYSHDGRLLASCGLDNTVRLWDTTDGRPLATLRAHTDEVNCLAFSHDGAWLASGDEASQLCIWDVKQAITGKPEGQQPSQSHTMRNLVAAVAISPDGKLVAVAAGETVEVLPLQADFTPFTLNGMGSKVTGVDFSPDGKHLYLSFGRSLSRWSLDTRIELTRREVHQQNIATLAISHRGDRSASADHFGNVCICDATTLEVISQPNAQVGRIDAVAFSPDDRLLAIGGRDRMVELWDVAESRITRVIRGHTGWVWSADFSPDGNAIATASRDGTVRVWDVIETTPRRIAHPNGGNYRVTGFSHDSRLLAAGDDTGNVEIWNCDTGERQAAWRAHWRPYGPRESAIGTVELNSLAFSPRGDLLATSGNDGMVRLWDFESGRLHAELAGDSCGSLGFSADGSYLSVDAERIEQCARIWNIDSRTCAPADFRFTGARTVFFVGSGSSAGYLTRRTDTIEFIRRRDDATQWTMSLPAQAAANMTVSPDGRLLAVGTSAVDRVVHLWETTTGNFLGSLIGHDSMVDSLAFAPDGRTLAGAGKQEGRVRLWDLFSRQELLTLEPDAQSIRQLSFSPDGSALAAAAFSSDQKGVLYLWVASGSMAAHQKRAGDPENAFGLGQQTVGQQDSPAVPANDGRVTEAHCYVRHCRLVDDITRDKFGGSDIPTFEEQCRDGVVYHAALSLKHKPSEVVYHQWPAECDPADVRGNLRFALNPSKQFSATPLFPLYPEDHNTLFASWRFVVLLPEEFETRQVPAAEIGPTEDLFKRFRRVHRWAKAHGYPGGFPTFADKRTPTGETYGVALIKPGMGEEMWVPVK